MPGGDRAINHVKAAPGYERALAAALGEDLDAALGGDGPRRWTGAEPQPAIPRCPPAPRRSPTMSRRRRPCSAGCGRSRVAESDDGARRSPSASGWSPLDGRLRRWDGYVATGMGAAAAERLIRVNRLAEIEQRAARRRAPRSRRPSAAAAEARAGDGGGARGRRCRPPRRGRGRRRDPRGRPRRGQRRRSRSSGSSCAAPASPSAPRRPRPIWPTRAAALAEAEAVVGALPDAGRDRGEGRRASRRGRARPGGARRGPRRGGDPCPRGRRRPAARRGGARKEQADWRARAAEAEKRHAEFGRRIAEAEAEAQRLAEAPRGARRAGSRR